MVRRISPLVLGLSLSLSACGARSALPGDSGYDGDPTLNCPELRIGLLGNPGTYDGGEFQDWLLASGASAQRVLTSPEETLSIGTLSAFDVVVLDWLTRDYSPEEAATLSTWVAGGGGVISMTGYDNVIEDDWHANSLLAPLGVIYGGSILDGPAVELQDHPITKGLGSIVFKGGYAITDLGGNSSTRTTVALLDTGNGKLPVGTAIEMGSGRAFVWGDEWVEFISGGPEPDFSPAFWVQSFAWTAPKACELLPPG